MPHRHYTQLSYKERVLIEDWSRNTSKDKPSLRKFARHLGRHPSTISRELDRNGRPPTNTASRVNKPRVDNRHTRGRDNQKDKDRITRYWKRRTIFLSQARKQYTAETAQRLADSKVKHPRLRLEQPENEELLSFVITTLDSRWSPEQISGRIKHEGLLPNISHQTIYDFIYAHPELGLKSYLRRKGKKYRKQNASTYNHTDNRKSIDMRPEEVEQLTRIGDLEGDTIVGRDQKSRLLTHNDRLSGKVSISRVLNFNAEIISKQAINDIKRIFLGNCFTITYDNGVEHSYWYKTEAKLSTLIYFAHPYHSWERGRNENTNGLIRDFLPKGTDFKTISDSDILMIESLLNNRPRKRLDWLTPNEYYTQHTQKANVAVEDGT